MPQFESLQSELPAIKYTNSRYRLEPFSVATAMEVILKTEPGISENAAHLVSENLAVNILSNFEKIAVEPFLLSLVCQKIYREILEHKAGEHQATADKIKKLVNDAIEVFINDVYDSIDDNTKEFIEDKLVTSDNKRTPFNYTEATRDPRLKEDIDKLTTDPEHRLLNLEQFLDSLHIELLHDRLLPPIAKRRAERQKRQEAEAFKARQTELENQYIEQQNKREEFHRMRRKKQKLLLLLYLALAVAVILVVIASSIIRERADKGKLADIFGKQTIAHIINLQQTEPFITLALAHSNYHRLSGMGLADSITQEFRKIFLETYKGHLFDKESLGFYASTLSKKNSLALASLKNESTEYPVLLLYNLADLTPAPEILHNDSAIGKVLLAMEKDTDHLSGENLKYSVNTATKQGFSDEEDFIYAIVKIQDSSFLKIWTIKPQINEKPIWIEDLTPLNLVSPKIFAKGGKVAILTRIKNKYLVNSFDIQGKKRMHYEVKLQNGLEEVEEVSLTNRSIITVEKDESGKVSRYRIYSKKKSWQAVAFDPPDGETTALTYYAGDSLSYVSKSKSETYVGFVDAAGNAVGATVKLPSHDASVLYNDLNYILYYNADTLEGQKKTDDTWQPMPFPKIKGSADQTYISFSQDKRLLAVTYAPRSIAVFDMRNFHLIDTFQVPEAVKNEPVFDPANRNLITVNGRQVYTHYFREDKKITDVDSLENILQKTTRFGKAWPISPAEKKKYDIQDDLQDTVKHRH